MGNWQIGKRRTGVYFEYDGDGRFDQEKWNKDDKRYWTRWLRRVRKEEVEEAVNDHMENSNEINIVDPVLYMH